MSTYYVDIICRHNALLRGWVSACEESGSGYAADAYEYEDDTEYEDSGSGSLESNEIDEEACSLQLYSQTYHRGAEMNTTKSNPDLGSFTDQAVSASLEGDCCWTLFEDRNFRSVGLICRWIWLFIPIRGSKIVLHPGRDYKSATSLGSLLTEVSSVQKTTCWRPDYWEADSNIVMFHRICSPISFVSIPN